MQRWVSKTFTSNGTWVAPAGVCVAFLNACGGGGAGDASGVGSNIGSGLRSYGGNPGFVSTVSVQIVPNTSYSITVGAGGGADFADGYSTTFGSLATFRGGTGSRNDNAAVSTNAAARSIGYRAAYLNHWTATGATDPQQQFASRGSQGSDSGGWLGGVGGGAAFGPGATGANGNGSNLDATGGTAAANSGSGGGGAGQRGNIIAVYSAGGLGGSGKLTVFWLE